MPTIQRFCAKRRAFMQSLKTWATFGRRWTKRVAQVEATAVSWALAALGRSPGAICSELEGHATTARAESTRQARNATVSGGGTATGAGTASQAPDLTTPEIVAAILVILIIGGLVTAVLIHRSRAKRALALAYAEEAASINTWARGDHHGQDLE